MEDYSNPSERAWVQFTTKKAEYETLTEQDEAALFAQCVELQVLKTPATAKFPAFDQMIVNGCLGHYNVSGFVDSQNSYGAMIRSNYTYNVEKDTSGKWKCTNQFIGTESKITSQMFHNILLWLVLGILGILIAIACTSCQMRNHF